MNVISHPNTINYCCNKPVTKYSQFLLYHFLLGIIKSIKPNKCQALDSSLRFCIPTATKTILHRTSPPDIHSYVQAIRSHVVNPTKKRSLTNFSFLHSDKFKEWNKENKAETYRNPSPERPSAILIRLARHDTLVVYFLLDLLSAFFSHVGYPTLLLKAESFPVRKNNLLKVPKILIKPCPGPRLEYSNFCLKFQNYARFFSGVTVSKRKTNKLLRGWHTQKA